jgi:lipid-A-disaccharide synthase
VNIVIININMLRVLYRGFSTDSRSHVVCILANSRSGDRLGADVMRDLKEISQGKVEFIGAGGERMASEGLKESFYDNEIFHPKPFVPFRSVRIESNNYIVWSKRNPITKNYTKPMAEVEKLIAKKDILYKIRGYRPNLILTIDSDILSWRIHDKLAQAYKTSALPKPKQVHMGKFISKYEPKQEEFLDHVLYTMPIEPVNWNKYKFPSTYIGHEAFERAYRFLLSRNGGEHLMTDDSVFMHRDHFYSETDQFIDAERKTFRTKFGIPDFGTVFFFAPGSLPDEVDWSLPRMRDTANLFMDTYASPYSQRIGAVPHENFTVVIPTTPKTYHQVSAYVSTHEFKCKVIILQTEEDKNSALAGSDLAICYNGEIVSECLVNQLSTVVIQNMKKLEFYFTLAWNRFANDLNIVADGNLLPEIIEGQCHAPKLLQVLGQWYESPPHKFWPLQGFEMYLHKMLPVKHLELGMGTHQEYYKPRLLAARKLWEFAQQSEPRVMPKQENIYLQGLNA